MPLKGIVDPSESDTRSDAHALRERYSRELAGEPCMLLCVLEREGLLTADVGACWYAQHFSQPYLRLALEMAGLLATVDREWYAKYTDPDLLVTVLETEGLLTTEPGREWYVRNIHPTYLHLALTKAGFQMEDDFLLDIDAILEEMEDA